MSLRTSSPSRTLMRSGLLWLWVLSAGAVFSQDTEKAEPAAKPDPEKQVTSAVENIQQGVTPYRRHIEQEGIAVEVSIDHIRPVNKVPGFFSEGDHVKIGFEISDTANGAPLGNAYPAGWLDLIPHGGDRSEQECLSKLKAFLGGGLFGTPEINLNEYYVVALNTKPTLTVVDPVFGFGGTSLLAMIPLDSPGGDWAKLSDQSRIFVSMPEAGKIAVVETATWELRTRLESGLNPVRTVLQPDEVYLWSAFRGEQGKQNGGVAVFRTRDLVRVATIETGGGAHDIVFDEGNRRAFISNEATGTVSVVDVASLAKTADIATGLEPVSLSYSPLAQAVYVSHRSGRVAIIDALRSELVNTLEAEPGLGRIRFAPGNRYAFLVNPEKDLLHIVDATKQRIVQSGNMLQEPDQVTFSDEIAYVRHRGNETVLMVALDEIGVEGKTLSAIDFPAGQAPPGRFALPTPADGIVQAPGANAVLVANGPDKAIYFYKEGMAAPMGHFANYSHEPRAVMVIDRSLKEHTRPGLYETFVKLDRPGLYDLVFFMDSPRMAHCFALEVAADPALEAERNQKKVSVRFLEEQPRVVSVGKEIAYDFAIVDQVTGKARSDLADVKVLVNLQPGIWHRRVSAPHLENGIYRVTFTPPRRGVYYLYAFSPSVELGVNNPDYLVIRAGPAKNPRPVVGVKPRTKDPEGN